MKVEDAPGFALLTRAQKLGTVVIASYGVVCLLVLVPYYKWFYRVGANLLHPVSLVASLGIVLFALLPLHIHARRPKQALLALVLSSLILFAGLQVNDWRYALTQSYIQRVYCTPDRVLNEDEVLGGIRAIRVDAARTGSFENTSHCLSVPCMEEFYHCSGARVRKAP